MQINFEDSIGNSSKLQRVPWVHPKSKHSSQKSLDYLNNDSRVSKYLPSIRDNQRLKTDYTSSFKLNQSTKKQMSSKRLHTFSTENSELSGSHHQLSLYLKQNRESLYSYSQISKIKVQNEMNQLQTINKKIQFAEELQKRIKAYPSKIFQDAKKLEILRRRIKQGDYQNTYVLPKENTVREDSIERTTEQQTFIHNCYIYSNVNVSWGPSSREGATLNSMKNNLYLYGGAGANKSDEVIIAQTQQQYYKWNREPITSSDEKQVMRSNHTAQIYKNTLIIFGGEIHKNQNDQKTSECSNSIKMINLITGEAKTLKQTGIIEARKGHTALIIGRNLMMHGGINQRGSFLNDLHLFDILTQKWTTGQVERNNFYQDGIAYHTTCFVEGYQNKQTDFIREGFEGVYFFGGIDSKGQVASSLIMLNNYIKPMKFTQVKTKGVPAIGRYRHSMNFIELLNLLVICGGVTQDSLILNDINLFNVKNACWLEIKLNGKIMRERCSHAATVIETKLFIFGGYSQQGYLSSDLLIIEFDSGSAKHLEQLEKQENQNEESAQKFFNDQINDQIKMQEQQQEQIKKRQELIQQLSFKSMNTYLPLPRKNPTTLALLTQCGILKDSDQLIDNEEEKIKTSRRVSQIHEQISQFEH